MGIGRAQMTLEPGPAETTWRDDAGSQQRAVCQRSALTIISGAGKFH
jgi:hypothetical protein